MTHVGQVSAYIGRDYMGRRYLALQFLGMWLHLYMRLQTITDGRWMLGFACPFGERHWPNQ